MNIKYNREYLKKQREETRSKTKFDLRTMSWLCQYALSENDCIQISGLSNLRTLLINQTEETYIHEPQLLEMYKFCLAVLAARIDKKLTKREYYVADAMGTIGNKYPSINPDNFAELNTNDAEWIANNVITEYMNTSDMLNIADDLKSACITLAMSDASDLQTHTKELIDVIKKANDKIRKNQVVSSDLNSINLSKPEEFAEKMISEFRSNTHILKTGMQAFNKILGGGFEGGRVYSMFGLAGEGKSTLLKNLAYQMALYNRGYICKDKTKKPCIIYLTMENQTTEEFQTMYNIAGYPENLKDPNGPTPEQVIANINNSGLRCTEPGDITIFMEYKPINSVDTSYLYTLVEQYADQGYEAIAVFQDYIKRIRPVFGNTMDERFRLGNVINEFKNFAAHYNIPVITASQLNREAARTVDDNRKHNKFEEMINGVGRSNIGESSLIDENLDASIMLVPCELNNTKYLGIKITKHRYRVDISGNESRFFQPFVQGNPVKLVEDVGCFTPAAVSSLSYDAKNGLFGGNNESSVDSIINNTSNTPDIKSDMDSFFDRVNKTNTPREEEKPKKLRKVMTRIYRNNNTNIIKEEKHINNDNGGFISNVPKPKLRVVMERRIA